MKIIENNEDVYLLSSATTYIIFCCKEYFSNLILRKSNVHTISGPVKIIEGSMNATIILPKGSTWHLKDALLSSRSKRNLLSSKMYAKLGTILKQ